MTLQLFGEKNIDIIYTDEGEKLVVKKTTGEWGDSKSENLIGLLPVAGKTGDPVKMYLREMGLVSLLSRESETRRSSWSTSTPATSGCTSSIFP